MGPAKGNVAYEATENRESAVYSRYKAYSEVAEDVTMEDALDELAADYAGELLENGELLDEFIARSDRSLLQRVLDALREFAGKLTGAEKQKAQSAEAKLAAALDAGAKQAESLQGKAAGATMGETKFSLKEDSQDERERTHGAGNLAKEGAENRGGAGEVQGAAGEAFRRGTVLRGTRGLNPSFGAKPVRSWAEGHTVEPDRDSVAYVEQQTAMEYGVPSFVVSDEAWAESGGSAPAFSAGGQIYFKETIPEKNRGMLAPHELTHIMKQVKYQMYLDFTARTAEMLDKSTYEAAILIERSAKHRGIDVFGKDGYLDIKKLNALDAKNRLTLFDELNATLYGHIGSGNMGGLRPYLEAAFHDFAAYAEELEAIHEQFKQHN